MSPKKIAKLKLHRAMQASIAKRKEGIAGGDVNNYKIQYGASSDPGLSRVVGGPRFSTPQWDSCSDSFEVPLPKIVKGFK